MINPGQGASKSDRPEPKVIDDDVEDIEEMKESELLAIKAASSGATLSEFENLNINAIGQEDESCIDTSPETTKTSSVQSKMHNV